MKTLPREPWRGSQICGWQIAYGLPWSRFCGEFKKLGSYLCEVHDELERMDGYGSLPKAAPGNAYGLRLVSCSQSWLVRDVHDELVGASDNRAELEDYYGFTLKWEPYEGVTPIPATAAKIRAWKEQPGHAA